MPESVFFCPPPAYHVPPPAIFAPRAIRPAFIRPAFFKRTDARAPRFKNSAPPIFARRMFSTIPAPPPAA